MKIAIVVYDLSLSGPGRLAANLANYWGDHYQEVTIVTLAGQDRDFFYVNLSVRRIALNLAEPSLSLFNAVIANAKRVYALRHFLKLIKPDVVIGLMPASSVLAILASFGLGCRVIASEHSYPPNNTVSKSWEAMRRFCYRKADGVVAVTEEIAQWIGQNCPARRIAIIQNPIPWPIPSAEIYEVPDDLVVNGRKMLLAAGRLSYEKGFDILLRTFAELAGTFPEWDLVIAGEGNEFARLKDMCEQLNISDRVYMPGMIGNMQDLYHRADIFVLSSRNEGFPIVLGEALACGCPAVSFDCDTGPRDIIRNGIDGILVPPEEGARGLAKSLAALMADDEMRQQMARNAKDSRERFCLERIIKQWEDLFDKIMKNEKQN